MYSVRFDSFFLQIYFCKMQMGTGGFLDILHYHYEDKGSCT